MKVCNCCQEAKLESEFHVTKYTTDGLTDSCKDCTTVVRDKAEAAWRK